MNGCGDCRLVDSHCPHTGSRCGSFDTRNLIDAEPCEHTPRAGNNLRDVPVETCRKCGAYRLWHIAKPGQWRRGPVPTVEERHYYW